MRKTIAAAAVTAFLIGAGLGPVAAPAWAVDRQSAALQGAVDLVETNPKLAEGRLKLLKSPTAKVYLAFLYMARKVPTPLAGQKVDSLMHEAAGQVGDATGLGDVEAVKRYHYTDMGLFLRHLRFITDADGCKVQVPTAIFKRYPDQAFKAYGPYWGSGRDGWLPIEVSKKEDVRQLPAVKAYIVTLEKMMGDPVTGTIRNAWYRRQSLSEIEASLTPKLFVTTAKTSDGQKNRAEVEKLLETWSNEELWNKVMCDRLERQMRAAVAPLAVHYQKCFNYPAAEAKTAAEAALEGIKLAYYDSRSDSLVEDRAGQVYDLYKTKGLSLADMQKGLGDHKLTEAELPRALRMAILNDASVEVIDWLLKNGAPTSGGIEPPLFTAVLRPDVVRIILKAGADVNEKNCIGKTALFQVVQFNAADTVKILLDAGAEVNHAMVATDSTQASEANNTGDFNYTVGNRTPLMYAAAFSDKNTIKLLLDKGADRKAADSKGAKALQFLDWNEVLSKADRDELKATLAP